MEGISTANRLVAYAASQSAPMLQVAAQLSIQPYASTVVAFTLWWLLAAA